MRKLNSQFVTTFVSEAGLGGQNGTYYGFVEMDRYYCMAVAEGYDGDGGQESAKLAVDAAIEAFVQKPGMSAGRIRACIKKAHKSLMGQSIRIRLKAGILLLVSDYTRFRYGVCGNVMLFALREAGIYHQSITHTVYQTMQVQGQTAEKGTGPKQETGNLYHYLGGKAGITVSGKIRLADGDLLLAATEGLWGRVNRVEILDAYESIQSVDEFMGDLQELYLRGSVDSIPCCCIAAVDIKKTYKENKTLKKKILIWTIVILLILAIVATVVVIWYRIRQRKQREVRSTMAVYEDTGDTYMADLNCLLARQEYEKAAEESKKLNKNAERLEMEQLFSEKVNISTLLDNAVSAYEARDYTTARAEYKKALELAKKYRELAPLISLIEQKQKLVSTGMEIDHYMQSAVMKEAEGDLAMARALYAKAEAMLRIVDDPEWLKEAQLALLRVQGQEAQEEKDERARDRDEVIIDADKQAALDAILAGDFEAALEAYTKIRDSYIEMEENEKAEETTQIILSLQKQARASGELSQENIDADEAAAFEAVLAGDTQTALALYTKVQEAYLALEDEEKAEEIGNIIASLGQEAPAEEEVPPVPETVPIPEQVPEGAAVQEEKETGKPLDQMGRVALEQAMTPILETALKDTANRDFVSAIESYRKIAALCREYGDEKTAAQMDAMVAGLEKLQAKEQTAEAGGNTDG